VLLQFRNHIGPGVRSIRFHICKTRGLRMKESYESGLVSVIIPTFNRFEVLSETMDSVPAQLYRPKELCYGRYATQQFYGMSSYLPQVIKKLQLKE